MKKIKPQTSLNPFYQIRISHNPTCSCSFVTTEHIWEESGFAIKRYVVKKLISTFATQLALILCPCMYFILSDMVQDDVRPELNNI